MWCNMRIIVPYNWWKVKIKNSDIEIFYQVFGLTKQPWALIDGVYWRLKLQFLIAYLFRSFSSFNFSLFHSHCLSLYISLSLLLSESRWAVCRLTGTAGAALLASCCELLLALLFSSSPFPFPLSVLRVTFYGYTVRCVGQETQCCMHMLH